MAMKQGQVLVESATTHKIFPLMGTANPSFFPSDFSEPLTFITQPIGHLQEAFLEFPHAYLDILLTDALEMTVRG